MKPDRTLLLPGVGSIMCERGATGWRLTQQDAVARQWDLTLLDAKQALVCADPDSGSALPVLAVMPILEEVLSTPAYAKGIFLDLGWSAETAVQAIREGVATSLQDGDRLYCARQTFWQHPAIWCRAPRSAGMAMHHVMTQGQRHPLRPPAPRGVVYERYVPHVDSVLTLRVVCPQRDLETFHGWMNQERVHRFWEMEGDMSAHAEYLALQLRDPKVLPLIGEFDGEPFGYFEVYWAKEDRISPYCHAGDYDRGCHVLVGNTRHRGTAKLSAWLRSLCHYLFLDDPRTQRIVGEPRVDNVHFLAHLQRHGFAKHKEFDFPHKRAALMVLEREVFFEQYGP